MNQLKPVIWSATLALVFLSIFLATTTKKTLRTPITLNTIAFHGQGKIAAKPDIALVEFSIVTKAPSSKAAQNDNSKKSSELLAYLKTQGIDPKDYKTTGYDIHAEYTYEHNISVFSGYRVSETLELKIRDLDKASELVDGIVSTGVNQVNQLRFVVENPNALKDQARALAINDAKAKANKLANQLGVSLGQIVNFTEDDGDAQRPIVYAKEMALSQTRQGPAFAAGENEFIVGVTITYQID